jgi:hypothetical protein
MRNYYYTICNSYGTAISEEHQHSYFSSFSSILYQLHNHISQLETGCKTTAHCTLNSTGLVYVSPSPMGKKEYYFP